MKESILETAHITKSFRDPVKVQVLRDVSLRVEKGEFVSVTGKSGCGKSTLLYILSTMDTDYDGDLYVCGQPMRGLTETQLAQVRNQRIGFVFQFHYLLNEFTVLDNVMLPGLKLGRHPEAEVRERALNRLEMLGIGALATRLANDISGGRETKGSDCKSVDQ